MAARDVFHDAVKKGLEKEGWVITDDPLEIELVGLKCTLIWVQRRY